MPNFADVNTLSREEFVRIVGPMFEHSPWVAERAFPRRPFGSRDELHTTLCDVVETRRLMRNWR
jgi:2-oxo-4-hydroxy-4-carboxy-5-ureidoimidazoline decarboxylase